MNTAGKLVLASGNSGKLNELSRMLEPFGFSVHAQSAWVPCEAVEDGLSFVENALIKARHASRHSALPALADDSGLVVDALDGAPGIHSARFAGPSANDDANNRKLLAALKGVEANRRTAHFYCVMALVRHVEDPAPLIAVGRWDGLILDSPRGENGFGYDPLFFLPDLDRTSAELDPAEKNTLSHRGKALRSLLTQLADG